MRMKSVGRDQAHIWGEQDDNGGRHVIEGGVKMEDEGADTVASASSWKVDVGWEGGSARQKRRVGTGQECYMKQ